MFSFYVTLTVHTKHTHTHRYHTQIDVLNLSSGRWQSMGYKKMAICFVCKSVHEYHSLSAVCLAVALQQMVTVPSAHIVVSLYTHAHTLSKEQSGT